MSTEVTFTHAFSMLDDALIITAVGSDMESFARFTRVFQFDEQKPPHWWSHDENWRTSAITYFGSNHEPFDDTVILSEEGHVQYLGDHPRLVEKIQGAGVFNEDAEGWGYLSDLQQIGDHLYATGYSGQVYKRLAANQWVHMDEGILQTPGMKSDHYSIQVINGANENAIYVAGCRNEPYYPVRASFWNGKIWRDLTLPEVAERITNIYVESKSRIWMCGANGTLLLGNADDGFRSLSTVDDNQLFLSLCMFQEKIYLGSNIGLFQYDPANHVAGIGKVITGLMPELQDANIVDSVDTILWSIGPKDIARFDGIKWERIHHPDNASIGGKTGGSTAGKP
jgi:hypothetical protein